MPSAWRGLAGAAAIAALCACGSSPSGTASPTPCGTAVSPAAQPSPSPAAASLMLTAAAFPCSGPSFTQVSDGLLNGTPGSDQRVFANAGNTYRVEDDLYMDQSAAAAQTDYPAFRDAAKKQVASLQSASTPPGLGAGADQFTGTASNGHSIIAITWADGSIIVAMLFESSGTAVDATFAQQAAQTQNTIIQDSANH